MRTVPVNQSDGPLLDGCEPALLISMPQALGWLLLQLHLHSTIVIGLHRGCWVDLIQLDFLQRLAGEVKQRLTHNCVVSGLKLMAIFKDENRSGRFIFPWRRRGVLFT